MAIAAASVTVYCSSSDDIDPIFRHAAAELGSAIARQAWTLVYGGNHCGTMGVLADAARAAGGRVVGITPQVLFDKKLHDTECDELIITPNLAERKRLLVDRGQAMIALPGGIGTYEEIFDALGGRQLEYHAKPVMLINIDGFYDPLLAMLEDGLRREFINRRRFRPPIVATSATDAIATLRTTPPFSG